MLKPKTFLKEMANSANNSNSLITTNQCKTPTNGAKKKGIVKGGNLNINSSNMIASSISFTKTINGHCNTIENLDNLKVSYDKIPGMIDSKDKKANLDFIKELKQSKINIIVKKYSWKFRRKAYFS